MPRSTRRFLPVLVLLLGGAALLWWAWRWTPARPPAAPATTDPAAEEPPAQPAPRVRKPGPRPSTTKRSASDDPECIPEAAERCHEGDVWIVDSCGQPEEKLDECGRQLCRDDQCDPEPSQPCNEPEEGRCDGDVVRMCLRGRPHQVDCAAQGLRCILGDEGAECAPLVPPGERCSVRQAPRCDGNVLVRCDQGRLERTDCATLAAKCLSLSTASEPRCVVLRAPDLTAAGCGPCGCAATSSEPEQRCDGRDDNDNRLVDEGLDCGPVDVVAFVVSDARGQTSHAREDVEREIELVNRLFMTDEGPALRFVLADLLPLRDSALIDLDSQELQQLISDPRVQPARAAFYVPVLFTESIGAGGGTPKLGVSTLPNGTCGGVQEGRGPELGLLAVAKGRSPTTLAHELGHFFGLCHTHERQLMASVSAVQSDSALTACGQGCRGEGDGVCDTPFDPGPGSCLFDEACQALCSERAQPDPANLMSYYTPCRQRFSPEQRQLMQHTLALRRGWHPCLYGACACRLGDDESCPVGMTCREYQRSDGAREQRCALDGPRPAGAVCEHAGQCGGGALCVGEKGQSSARCVRPCSSSRADCQCGKVADDLSVCLQDLK